VNFSDLKRKINGKREREKLSALNRGKGIY
jgi:hypothetical protein